MLRVRLLPLGLRHGVGVCVYVDWVVSVVVGSAQNGAKVARGGGRGRKERGLCDGQVGARLSFRKSTNNSKLIIILMLVRMDSRYWGRYW